MQTTLHEHILHLKDRIQALSNRLTSNRSRAEQERIESELRTAESALDLYLKAFETEQQLPLDRM